MLDLLIVVVAASGAVAGYQMGFFARAASWAGAVAGIVAGTLLLPSALEALGPGAERGEVVLVTLGLLVGCSGLGFALGHVIGARARLAIEPGAGRTADSVGGAAAGVLGVVALVWLLAPALADAPGWQAQLVRESRIVGALHDRLPDPPDATQTLRRLLGDDYPQVFEGLAPSPDAGPVPGTSGLDQATVDEVAASVVLVANDACGDYRSGTGWVVAPGLVVTNAHVVAGDGEPEVQTQGGADLGGTVLALDPVADLALVGVDGLRAAPLPVVDSEVGATGAVFGHPGGGPLELSPFEISDRLVAQGRDIYDAAVVERDLLVVAADLAPGDSGAPLVDVDGQVVAVAFAVAPDRTGVAYAVPTSAVRDLLAAGAGAGSAGPCLG